MSRKASPAKTARALREQTTLEFANNAHVQALAGGHSRHFVRLEQKLDVRIATRGNLVAVEGAASAREQASRVLRALYARLEAGDDIAPADVDAELRFAATGPQDGPVEEMGTASIRTGGNKITRARSAMQATYLDQMRANELVFGIGPAGTGKTYLAAAFGAHLLHQRRVERLVLSRPALEAGERLGFLPGDLREKVDPYLRPLYDALFDVMGPTAGRLMDTGIIEVAPLAFMRGRTLAHAFVILDEAQNTTPAQMKMFLTRLGEGSRMVVTGDLSQSDLTSGPEGLAQALDYLSGVEGVAVARFTAADVVRHPLVTRIVTAYEAREPGGVQSPRRTR